MGVKLLHAIFVSAGKKLNYICKTDKKLTMSRVVLKPKETPHEDTDVPPTGDSTEEATDYEGTEGTEPPQGNSPPTQTLP